MQHSKMSLMKTGVLKDVSMVVYIHTVVPVSSVTKSCLTLCDPMDSNPQSPLSRRFSRQEYWSGLPFPSPGTLPKPGIKHTSPALAGRFFTNEPSGKPHMRASVVSDSVRPCGCSLLVSSVHGILQARILEQVAVPSSRGPS